MKESQEENSKEKNSGELEKYRIIEEHAEDLTDVLFDLFFDENFRGNTEISKKTDSDSDDINS